MPNKLISTCIMSLASLIYFLCPFLLLDYESSYWQPLLASLGLGIPALLGIILTRSQAKLGCLAAYFACGACWFWIVEIFWGEIDTSIPLILLFNTLLYAAGALIAGRIQKEETER
jgi:hypothetical protein